MEAVQYLPIVVDTNIFLHLVDPRENQDGHISHLLLSIARTHELKVDKAGEIEREYKRKLIDVITSLDETPNRNYKTSDHERTDTSSLDTLGVLRA